MDTFEKLKSIDKNLDRLIADNERLKTENLSFQSCNRARQAAEAENIRYRKALDFYADEGNWKYLDVMYDKGEIARQARKGENHE